MTKKKEIWKDVVGYEGEYQVSSFGRVRSLSRTIEFTRLGNKAKSFRIGKIISPRLTHEGYLGLVLSRNGEDKTVKIHRLVAQAFISNPFLKNVVNHKDGIKTNNYYKNLEWVTYKENTLHAYSSGIYDNRGSKNYAAKLKEKDVRKIRRLYSDGNILQYVLAKKYNVDASLISYIVNYKKWKHI